MKKIYAAASLLISACLALTIGGCGGSSQLQPANLQTTSITQFGITWTFDRSYNYGQFANGDYWVVGPVTITGISPKSVIDITGRTLHGSEVNPSPRENRFQGYDSAMPKSSFSAALNAARPNQQDLTPLNPLTLAPGSSLVSSISLPTPNARPQLKTAAILTVLASAPPAGSFRPPYSGSNKTIRFNKSQLDYTLLKRLAPVANTPSLAVVERYFERPWIDHIPGWRARYQHPSDNMPDYGRAMAIQISQAALMLHLNFSNAAKEKLLIRYVQLGIDLYGVAMDGGNNNWMPDGGHTSGRKWPILFAGLMLGDTAMQHIGPGDGTGTVHFGEDGQTFYVSQADINMVHVQDPLKKTPVINYVQADLGLPEWGIRHSTNPSRDDKDLFARYRRGSTAVSWVGFVLAARIMQAQTLWAHNALFDYQDRYMTFSTPPGFAWYRNFDKFSTNMWDTYRLSY